MQSGLEAYSAIRFDVRAWIVNRSDGTFNRNYNGDQVLQAIDQPNDNFSIANICSNLKGINDLNKFGVALFPNLVQNTLQVNTFEGIECIKVFSITRKELLRFSNQQDYDISQLPAGMYFVKLKSTRDESIQRVVKR